MAPAIARQRATRSVQAGQRLFLWRANIPRAREPLTRRQLHALSTLYIGLCIHGGPDEDSLAPWVDRPVPLIVVRRNPSSHPTRAGACRATLTTQETPKILLRWLQLS